MIIIFYTYVIPRYNWSKTLRGLDNFVAYYAGRTQQAKEQLDELGKL